MSNATAREEAADATTPRSYGPGSDPEEVARKILLRRLELRAHTRSELAQILAGRGVPVSAASNVLDRFVEVGLIDDQAFAEAWIDSRGRGGGRSRRLLRQELLTKGVPPDVLDKCLEELGEEQELAAARAFAARRFGRTRTGESPEKLRRRVLSALQRRGFSTGIALKVAADVVLECATPLEGDAPERLSDGYSLP
jgi:regulatory protein